MPIGRIAVFRICRLLVFSLVISIATSSFGEALFSVPAAMNSAVLHQKLHSRGIGSGVRVTKVDGTVVRGTLIELEPDSFEVIPQKTVRPTRIPNSHVARLDNAGLPKRAKQAIGIVVGLVVVVSLVVIATSISFTPANV
jgi:hypothetical protein